MRSIFTRSSQFYFAKLYIFPITKELNKLLSYIPKPKNESIIIGSIKLEHHIWRKRHGRLPYFRTHHTRNAKINRNIFPIHNKWLSFSCRTLEIPCRYRKRATVHKRFYIQCTFYGLICRVNTVDFWCIKADSIYRISDILTYNVGFQINKQHWILLGNIRSIFGQENDLFATFVAVPDQNIFFHTRRFILCIGPFCYLLHSKFPHRWALFFRAWD